MATLETPGVAFFIYEIIIQKILLIMFGLLENNP